MQPHPRPAPRRPAPLHLSALALIAVTALSVAGALSRGGAYAAEPAVEPAEGVAMHGEPRYAPGFAHLDYADPNAPKGGVVTFAATGTFDSFNPYIIKGQAAAGTTLIYESLTAQTLDEPFSEYGLLAETIEMPEDRSWVAFTLRPEARWHDGLPVTVEDVIWSFETLRDQGTPFFRYYYKNVASVVAEGERRVRFDFEDTSNLELPLIIGQLPILPRHAFEGRAFDTTTLDPPLGSGPYRIKSFEPGRAVVYERVADYWGADIPVNKGRYNFDEIRYEYYRDANVAIEAFKAGEFDFRAENTSKFWATAYTGPRFDSGMIVLEELPHARGTGMQGYLFNTRRALFQDPRVRQAIAHAFDFEWTNKSVMFGQYARTTSFFSNSELASSGLPDEAELALLEPFRDQLPEEVFTTEYQPPSSDGSGNIRGNLRTALGLLGEAGWTVQGGVLKNAAGEPFTFEFLLLSAAGFDRHTLPFVKNLERLGIQAEVRLVDPAQYRNRLDQFDFDVVVGSFGQSQSPGNEQRDFWGSEAAGIEGSRNLIGISDPVVDALVERIIEAPSREALLTACRALDRVLLWGHYLIPQWHSKVDRIAYWNKFGRPDVLPTYGVDLFAWWVDPAKLAARDQETSGQSGAGAATSN